MYFIIAAVGSIYVLAILTQLLSFKPSTEDTVAKDATVANKRA